MIHSTDKEDQLRGSNAQADLLERLFSAASNGEKEAITNMVSLFTSVSIDERNEHGWSALMLAARNGHSNVVQHLLEQGYANYIHLSVLGIPWVKVPIYNLYVGHICHLKPGLCCDGVGGIWGS